MTALPRNRRFALNDYELGFLHASIKGDIMDRMKTEAPGLWLQIMANIAKTYAESSGHPMQSDAQKQYDEYHQQFHELLKRESE